MLTSNIAGVENGVNKETKFHYRICVGLLYLLVTGESAKCQHAIAVSQANRDGYAGPVLCHMQLFDQTLVSWALCSVLAPFTLDKKPFNT